MKTPLYVIQFSDETGAMITFMFRQKVEAMDAVGDLVAQGRIVEIHMEMT